VAIYDKFINKKIWCECCGEQGHKFYECPDKFLGTGINIFCSLCGSKSHPANDCPDKKKKKQVEEELTIEEQFHNFMQDFKHNKEEKEKMKAITYGGEIGRLIDNSGPD